MAIKLPSFKFFSATDAKSRIFIVFLAVLGIAGIIYFIGRYFSGPQGPGASIVAAPPSGLQSIPGSKLSPEYYRTVTQASAQAAQQAQITGGSAVPTLLNVPTPQPQAQSCTILCPSTDEVNVSGDLNDLVKAGKLSQQDASALLALAKDNVPVSELTAALDQLVKDGKLTPAQARDLLAKYKKQHENALLRDMATPMDALIKSGKLSLDAANQLLALQKSGITPSAYAAELNGMAKDGKLPAQTAAQLAGLYAQQQAQEATKDSIFGLRQLAKAGAITPDVVTDLATLQAKNVPIDAYGAELQRLIQAGKMTPEQAAKLLDMYKAKRASLGTGDALNTLVGNEEAAAANDLNAMVNSGKLSPDLANALQSLQQKNVPPPTYQAALDSLVKQKKLDPADAQKLSASYQKLNGVRAEAQHLGQMQANNASTGDYADELKRAVQTGLISPEDAGNLMQEYQTMTTPVTVPTIQTNIPGTSDFAKLQQKVQETEAQTPAVTTVPTENTQQFAAAAAQAEAQALQDRQQRIAQLQTLMSGQAQQLIAAWQPPKMVHQAGSASITTETTTTTGSSLLGGVTKLPGGPGAPSGAETPSLIKAGTIYFGILDTAVDSDYPDTPVMVTIVEGPFKGAKLLGKLALAKGQDRVSLNFNLMDKDGWPKSKAVNAFAIDPDTARTAIASKVDYHYLKRYGAMMGAAFMTGYSNAILNEGTSTTGIFGTSSTHPALSPGNKLAVGLGQVGTTMGTAIQSYINTPTTVKVNSGVALGVLFMSEVN